MCGKLLPAMLLCTLVSFTAVCALVLTDTAQAVNSNVYRIVSLASTPALSSTMAVVSNAGEWYVYAPVAVALLAVPKTARRFGLPAAAVLVASVVCNNLLKQIFHVARPDVVRLTDVTGYGFPSGHAMNGTAFVGTCVCLLCKYSHKMRVKAAAGAASAIFILSVGYSRIYLGAHSFTDVIGGFLCGLTILMSAIIIINAREGANAAL